MNILKTFFGLVGATALIACTPLGTETDTPTPEIFISRTQAIPSTIMPTEQVATPPTIFDGVAVALEPVSLVLPPGLASGLSGAQMPRADGSDMPTWGLTPGHTELTLEGYALQEKFHQPRFYLYPAAGYAELNPLVAQNIQILTSILKDPCATLAAEQLPKIPFFNAQQVFASNIQTMAFQNGHGVRSLTEYGQYPAPANNVELFYHFQGLTSDGAFYIIAILPITAQGLGESLDPTQASAIDGVEYPKLDDTNPDWQGYYGAVINHLNGTLPEAFAPTLNQLDMLIQSVRIER
jgi:hypothetical protein